MSVNVNFMFAKSHMAISDANRQRYRFPNKRNHERRGGAIIEFLRRADLLDAAFIKYNNPIGKFHRLILVMRHEDGSERRLSVNIPKPTAQILAYSRVQRAEWFIEKQHPRFDRECARKRHALPLSARQLCRIAFP